MIKLFLTHIKLNKNQEEEYQLRKKFTIISATDFQVTK